MKQHLTLALTVNGYLVLHPACFKAVLALSAHSHGASASATAIASTITVISVANTCGTK